MTTVKSAIIHFGPYKTGSTSIQMYLNEHRDLLASSGVCYPVGKIHQSLHSEIPIKILKNEEMFSLFMPELKYMALDEIIAEYLSEARDKGTDTLLLSSENFARFSKIEELNELLTSLAKFDIHSVHIIYYFFNPEDRLKSMRAEYIKHGEHFTEQGEKELLNYMYKLLDNFMEIRKNIKNPNVRFIDKNYNKREEVIVDLVKILEVITQRDLCLPESTNSYTNTILPPNVLDAWNEFNLLNHGRNTLDFNSPTLFSANDSVERKRLLKLHEIVDAMLADIGRAL